MKHVCVCIIALWACQADAQEFGGRLFTDESQRGTIDAIRFGRPLPDPAVLATPADAASKPILPGIHFSGMVSRENHKNTVWVNGKAYKTEQSADAWRYGHLTQDGLRIYDDTGKRILIKPGQRFDPLNGLRGNIALKHPAGELKHE